MYRIAANLLLAFLLCGCPSTQESRDSAADREIIRKNESDWAQSVVTRDLTNASSFLAEDYVGVQPDGAFFTKTDELNSISKDNGVVSNVLGDDMRIRLIDNVAIAQGSENWTLRDGSKGGAVWTDVWVKRNGKWQMVSSMDVERSK